MWGEKTGIRLKRDELYEQVWATPMRTLAKQYGISDVGLKKICRKLNVPVPGLGYWARIHYGQKVSRPALPPIKAGQPSEHVISHAKPRLQIEADSEAYEKIAFENDPRNKITVAQRLMKPHPLVDRTERATKAARLHDSGVTFPREKGCLDIEVNRDNLNRALRIMDALLKAMEARGYRVAVMNKDRKQMTLATVLEEEIEFGLRESYRQHKREEKEDSWGPKYEYYPSGVLALNIKLWVYDVQKTWSDGKVQRLEDCLNHFIAGLVKVATKIKLDRIEREEKERKYQEELRVRKEKARLRQEELERVKALEEETDGWHKAQRTRTYVEAVREMAIQQHGEIQAGSALEQWVIWALRQADRFDPLVESPPSILDEGDDYGLSFFR